MAPSDGGSPRPGSTSKTPSFDLDRSQSTTSPGKRKCKRKGHKSANLVEPQAIEIYNTDAGSYETVFVDPLEISPRGPRLIVSAKSIRTLQHMYKMTSARAVDLMVLLDQCRNAFFKELQFLREQLESPRAEKDLNVFFFDPAEYFMDKETSDIFRAEVMRRTFPLQTDILKLKKQLKLVELSGGAKPPSIKAMLAMLQDQTKISDLMVMLSNLPNADEEAFKQMLFIANHKLGIDQDNDQRLNEILKAKAQTDVENSELKELIVKLKQEVKSKTDAILQVENDTRLEQSDEDRAAHEMQLATVMEEMAVTELRLIESELVIENMQKKIEVFSHDQLKLKEQYDRLADENSELAKQSAESKRELEKVRQQVAERQDDQSEKMDHAADDATRKGEPVTVDIQVSQAVELSILIVKEQETSIEGKISEELCILQEMFGATFHNFRSILQSSPVEGTKVEDANSQLELFLDAGVEASYRAFVEAHDKEPDRSDVRDPANVSRALASCGFPNPPQNNDVLTAVKHIKGAMRSYQHRCFGFANVVTSFLSQLNNIVTEHLDLLAKATPVYVETKAPESEEEMKKEPEKHDEYQKPQKVEQKTVDVLKDSIVIRDDEDAELAERKSVQKQMITDHAETAVQTDFTLKDFNDLPQKRAAGTLKDKINQMIFQRRFGGLMNDVKQMRMERDALNEKYAFAIYRLRQEMATSPKAEDRRRMEEAMFDTGPSSFIKRRTRGSQEYSVERGRLATRLSTMVRQIQERQRSSVRPEQATPSPLAAEPRQTLPQSSVERPTQATEQSSVEEASHATQFTSVERPTQAPQELSAERPRRATQEFSVERPRRPTQDSSVAIPKQAILLPSVEGLRQETHESSVAIPKQAILLPSIEEQSYAPLLTSIESPSQATQQFSAESPRQAMRQSLGAIPKRTTQQRTAYRSMDVVSREPSQRRLIEEFAAGASWAGEMVEDERSRSVNVNETSPIVPLARSSHEPVLENPTRKIVFRIPDAIATSPVSQRFRESSASRRFRSSSAHHGVGIAPAPKGRKSSNQLHRAIIDSYPDGNESVPLICQQRDPFLLEKTTGSLRPETNQKAEELFVDRMNAPSEMAVERGRMEVSGEEPREGADFTESYGDESIEALDDLPYAILSETEGPACGYERSKLLYADHLRRQRRTKKLDPSSDRLSKSQSDFTGARILAASLSGLRTIPPHASTTNLFDARARSTIQAHPLIGMQHLKRQSIAHAVTDVARITVPEFHARSRSKGQDFGKMKLSRDRSRLQPPGADALDWASSSFSLIAGAAQGLPSIGKTNIPPPRPKPRSPLHRSLSPSRNPTPTPGGRASEWGLPRYPGSSSHREKKTCETFPSFQITQLVDSTRKHREIAASTRDRMPASIQLLLADVDKMLDAKDAEGKKYNAHVPRRKKNRSDNRNGFCGAARNRSASPPPDLCLMVPSPREKSPRRVASPIFPHFAPTSGMKDRSFPDGRRV
eukprot:GEMP01001349.1.p1 GENE.GEMP01001349.1~~GEMP01001349.1.p1  ORF type:complete len:1481 (+),score=299.68 GEMP01001349.1:2-4444(+)